MEREETSLRPSLLLDERLRQRDRDGECKVDLSTRCPHCLSEMIQVHGHYECERCHYRDSCCM